MLNPRQHLLRCHNDLGGILKPHVIGKVLWINHSDSMGDYPMRRHSGGEGWVAEVSDYFEQHQRVHERLRNRPWGAPPPALQKLILEVSDQRFPGLLVGDEL
jgi:hypothetical protein